MQHFWAVALFAAGLAGNALAGETVVRVTDIHPGAGGSYPSYLTEFRQQILFRASPGNGATELWRFDGTNAFRAAPLAANASPTTLVEFNGQLYFDAQTATGGIKLHRFDGTNVTVPGVNPPGAFWSSGAARPITWSGRLWWRSLHFSALGIAQFNGTTISVLNSPPWANSEPVLFNGALYYGAQDSGFGVELWRYTGSGQQRLSDMNPGAGDGSPEELFVHAGAIYFRARDGSTGNELWRYNGSSVQRVADLNPNGDANPGGFASFRGALYFAADDGVHGAELFRYDGASVTLAANVNPNPVYEQGGDRLSDSHPSRLTVFNDALYFIAWDGTNTGVRRFDGTNTVVLGGGMLNAATELLVCQGSLYFDADDGLWGRELWRVETNAQPRLSITRQGGMVQVQLDEAETGRIVIEGSGDFRSWTPLVTNRPMDGRILFDDPAATTIPIRAYRAVRAP
jgi:ELWxxDGT repeat protein